MVAWVCNFAHLPVSQCCHVVVGCASLSIPPYPSVPRKLPHLSTNTRWHENAYSHACHVPAPTRGTPGKPVCMSASSGTSMAWHGHTCPNHSISLWCWCGWLVFEGLNCLSAAPLTMRACLLLPVPSCCSHTVLPANLFMYLLCLSAATRQHRNTCFCNRCVPTMPCVNASTGVHSYHVPASLGAR